MAVFLLGVGLCFLTVLGHGKVDKRLYKEKASAMHFSLLDARATYIMHNPTSFLKVFIGHDSDGETFREFFPADVSQKKGAWWGDARIFLFESYTEHV